MQRIHVNLRAIGDWKSAGASIEGKEEVGPGEQDDLGTLIATRALTDRKQLSPRFVRKRHLGCGRTDAANETNVHEVSPNAVESYSITSSARVSTAAGMARPSALAALRLIERSNLVGCSTGRLAGFSPLRILPTYSPIRR